MSDYYRIEPPEKVNDWKGCYVISRKIVRNLVGELPTGTIFKITSSGTTKRLQSLPCECCGLKLEVTSKKIKDEFLLDFTFIEFSK